MSSKIRAYLIVLNGYNPNKAGGAGQDTLYFGTHGYTSAPTDTPANTYFEPRITDPGLYSQSAFSPGTTGGQSSGGFGVVELTNADGNLDYMIDWGFDGFSCTVYEGRLDQNFSQFAPVISGTVQQIEHSWYKISLRFKDRVTELDKPLALHYYAGNNILPNGIEGTTDIKGTPKPRLFGTCFNIEPILVNTSLLIYQITDGSVSNISGVRDRGVALGIGTSRANSAALLANAPAVSKYDYCLSEGLIRLGSNPAGQITVDATKSNETLGAVIKTVVTEKISALDIVEQSLIDLDRQTTVVQFGFYTGKNDITTKQFLDEMSLLGFWWGFSNTGKFWVNIFVDPETIDPILYLDNSKVLEVERIATQDSDKGVPIWKVNCKFKKNHTVQNEVAASVTPPDKYATEFLTATYSDASIKTKHPLSEELTIDSPFYDSTSALAEATRQFNLRSVRRDRLRLTIPLINSVDENLASTFTYTDGGYWDDFGITDQLGWLTNGKAIAYNNYLMTVVGNGVERIDKANSTAEWSYGFASDLPYYVENHAIVIHNNYLYVVGGFQYLFSPAPPKIIRLDLNNPLSGWDDAGVTDLWEPLRYHQAVVHNNYLYVIGGEDIDTTTVKNTVKRLDLNSPTGAWDDSVTDYPVNVRGHQAVVHNNYLYVLGGDDGTTLYDTIYRLDLNNPTGAWVNLGHTIPTTITNHFCTIYDDYLYLIGGRTTLFSNSITNKCYSLDMSDPVNSRFVDNAVSDFPSAQENLSGASFDGEGLFITSALSISPTKTYRYRNNNVVTDRAELNSLGRVAEVTLPRYGYTSGRKMTIIGTETSLKDRRQILELWG